MLLPESPTIQVAENTDAVHYVVLPKSKTFGDFKDNIANGLTPLFPLSANQEIIIRQMTEDLNYLVLPRKPPVNTRVGSCIGSKRLNYRLRAR